MITRIKRVWGGTDWVFERGSIVVLSPRSPAVTGPIAKLPSATCELETKNASTLAPSSWLSQPPSRADSVACAVPASIAAALALTSTVSVAVETGSPGPPAKRLLPPPDGELGAPFEPYWITVKEPVVTQPGGRTIELSVAPGVASASP